MSSLTGNKKAEEEEVPCCSSSDEDEFVDAVANEDKGAEAAFENAFGHHKSSAKESSDPFASFQEDNDDNSDRDDKDDRNDNSDDNDLIKEKSVSTELELRRERENQLGPEELQERRTRAQSLKSEANSLYSQSEYNEALALYSQCLEVCPLKYSADLAVFHNNKGVVLERLGRVDEAVKSLGDSINLDPNYLKALLRRGRLLEQQEKVHEALKDFQKVNEIDKDNREALAALQRLPEKVRVKEEQMKKEMFDNLKKLGNMVLNPFGLSTDNFQFVQDPNTGGYSVNFNQNPR